MTKMKTAAPTAIGSGGKSTQKVSTRSLKHNRPVSATFIAIMDGGRFVGLRRFEDRTAARVAMRQGTTLG